MATILEKLQQKYAGRSGVSEARNIAEVFAGNQGANAIVDVIDGFGKSTVLYTDGTLIINEMAEDRAANVAEHGEAVKIYNPYTSRVPYVSTDIPWANDRASIHSVKFGSTVKPTSTSRWFYDLANCTAMDFTGLDTSAVLSMNAMFVGCSALTSLDLSSFDTSNVTDIGGMFYDCTSLTSLNLSSFDTSNVTNMGGGVFTNCRALTSLDLSNFDTSKVTNLGYMFTNCYALAQLNIGSFDTSKVIDMTSLFNHCRALETIDIRNFDTSKVTAMSYMFQDCQALETIIASDKFVTTAVTKDSGMFSSSANLVGGNGTPYSSSHVTSEYARIDTEETPGYFTAAS